MHERRCFVQFMHPGGEHAPDASGLKRWNRGRHQRKFLLGNGSYVAGGTRTDGEIVFWGEWEAESAVSRRYEPPLPDGPRFLYEPYFIDHQDGIWRQNTDPFVFGERFHYTGCLQNTRVGPTQLRYLAPGSIVLFGSCRAKSRFVLDTVFVVAGHIDHDAHDWQRVLDGRISPAYRKVTIEPWYCPNPSEDEGCKPDCVDLPGQRYRLYIGATPEQPFSGMFSFFPCRPNDARTNGFARPEMRLPGYVTSHLTQGKKIARDLTLTTLSELWREVTRQVQQCGLALGVYAELPPKRGLA